MVSMRLLLWQYFTVHGEKTIHGSIFTHFKEMEQDDSSL